MVLPVTVRRVSEVKAGGEGDKEQLTGLDEDLHGCGGWFDVVRSLEVVDELNGCGVGELMKWRWRAMGGR